MCGIIGYAGHRPAVPLLIEGLRRLEYRGYDSAGVAYIEAGALRLLRAEGKLGELEKKINGRDVTMATTGIGHTRWATHGVPVERNAHPHKDNSGRLALIHTASSRTTRSARTSFWSWATPSPRKRTPRCW
jgi:glucosamine--fructose-6-phosphate aminotransferase (isomerizing)